MKKILFFIIITIIIGFTSIGYVIFTQLENSFNQGTSDALTKNIDHILIGDLTPITLIVIFALIILTIILYKKSNRGKNNDMSLLW